MREPPKNVTASNVRPRPFNTAAAPSTILSTATIVPTKKLEAPRVAVVPTDQYTLFGSAPFVSMIDEWSPVSRVSAA